MKAKLVKDFTYLKPKTKDEIDKGKEDLLAGSSYKFSMKDEVLAAIENECNVGPFKYNLNANALSWLARYIKSDFDANDKFFHYNLCKSLIKDLNKLIKKYKIK